MWHCHMGVLTQDSDVPTIIFVFKNLPKIWEKKHLEQWRKEMFLKLDFEI